jgi:hypothetical protein
MMNSHPIFKNWHPIEWKWSYPGFENLEAKYKKHCRLLALSPYTVLTKRMIKLAFHAKASRLLDVPVQQSVEGYWSKTSKDDKEKWDKFLELYGAECEIRRFLKTLGTRGFRAWKQYLAERVTGDHRLTVVL